MSISRAEFIASAATVSLALPAPRRAQAPNTTLHIRRLAWAGISLVSDDAQLFIDPTYEGPHDPPLTADAKDRFAIISHHHGDHFDAPSVASAIGDRGFLALEERVAQWADTRTLHVQRVSLHHPVMMPRGTATFCATPVPALDGLGAPQTSWIIEVGGMKLIHLGDTQWHGGLWDIARAYGPFDAAFVPINGFQQVAGRYANVGQPMSLSPAQAASALQLLRPTVAIPIHYGSPDPPTYLEMDRPLENFLDLAKKANVRVVALKPGESLSLTRNTKGTSAVTAL